MKTIAERTNHHDKTKTHEGKEHVKPNLQKEAEKRSEQDRKLTQDDYDAIEAQLEPIRKNLIARYMDFRAGVGHELKVPPAPNSQSTGKCVECGKPVAMGQTYVCTDHMRTS